MMPRTGSRFQWGVGNLDSQRELLFFAWGHQNLEKSLNSFPPQMSTDPLHSLNSWKDKLNFIAEKAGAQSVLVIHFKTFFFLKNGDAGCPFTFINQKKKRSKFCRAIPLISLLTKTEGSLGPKLFHSTIAAVKMAGPFALDLLQGEQHFYINSITLEC